MESRGPEEYQSDADEQRPTSPLVPDEGISRSNSTNYLYSILSADPDSQAKELERIKALVDQVGPRIRTFTGISDEEVCIRFIGCQGDPGDKQGEVAGLLNKLEAKKKSTINVVLGDNAYGKVRSATEFKTYFHDKFIDNVKKLYFAIFGNHDLGFELVQLPESWGGRNDISKYEFACSYEGDPETIMRRFANADGIYDVQDGQAFNMPYYFDCYRFGSQVALFLLNSNEILQDFLLLLNFYQQEKSPAQSGITTAELISFFDNEEITGKYNSKHPKNPLERNQVYWLKKTYALMDKEGRQKLFAQHHPLFRADDGAFQEGNDVYHYHTKDEIEQLKKHFGVSTDFFGELIATLYDQLGTRPNKVFAAHRHALSYIRTPNLVPQYQASGGDNTNPICLLTAGAGGSHNLMKRQSVRGYQETAFDSAAEHGVLEIVFHPNKPGPIEINFHTINGETIKFDDQSTQPIREIHADNRVEDLREKVIKTYNEYMQHLNKLEEKSISAPASVLSAVVNQGVNLFGYIGQAAIKSFSKHVWTRNSKESTKELHIADRMRNHFNQAQLKTYDEELAWLQTNIDALPLKTKEDGLYARLKDNLGNHIQFKPLNPPSPEPEAERPVV